MNTVEKRPAPGPLSRRIAEQKPQPEWKPLWMRRLPAKDLTGRVMA